MIYIILSRTKIYIDVQNPNFAQAIRGLQKKFSYVIYKLKLNSGKKNHVTQMEQLVEMTQMEQLVELMQ